MLLNERVLGDDDKLVIKKTHDFEPALNLAGALRSNDMTGFSENKLIATVPMALVAEWLKEAGVKWDDPAAKDVIKRKLLSGDVSKFRVWDGSY